VASLTRSHPDTVSLGARELEQGIGPGRRVRQAGAGRPPATGLDPGLVDALRELVEPETRGDPMRPLVWTTKSAGNLAGELGRAGRPVSAGTVGRLLKDRTAATMLPPKHGFGGHDDFTCPHKIHPNLAGLSYKALGLPHHRPAARTRMQ